MPQNSKVASSKFTSVAMPEAPSFGQIEALSRCERVSRLASLRRHRNLRSATGRQRGVTEANLIGIEVNTLHSPKEPQSRNT